MPFGDCHLQLALTRRTLRDFILALLHAGRAVSCRQPAQVTLRWTGRPRRIAAHEEYTAAFKARVGIATAAALGVSIKGLIGELGGMREKSGVEKVDAVIESMKQIFRK